MPTAKNKKEPKPGNMEESEIELLRRIESTSLKYLTYFFLFWGALIFFIIQQNEQNKIATGILKNLVNIIIHIGDIASLIHNSSFDFIVLYLSFFTIFLTLLIFIILLSNGIPSIDRSKRLSTIITEKHDLLEKCKTYGIINSLLLVSILIYLAIISTPIVRTFFNNLTSWVMLPLMIGLYIIAPLAKLIVSWESGNRNRLLFGSLTCYGLTILLFYPINFAKNIIPALVNWNANAAGLILLIWIALFPIVSIYDVYKVGYPAIPQSVKIVREKIKRHERLTIIGIVIVLGLILVGLYLISSWGYFEDNSKPNPSFYCDSKNETCMRLVEEIQNNCTDYNLIIDYYYTTLTLNLTRVSDNCQAYYFLNRSTWPELKGDSMSCEIPLPKAWVLGGLDELALFKYCEGSLKDNYLNISQDHKIKLFE